MCRSKKSNSAQQQNARNPVRVVQMESPEYEEYSLNQVTTAAEKCSPQKPLEVEVRIEGKEIAMELDTGAAVSLVSKVEIGCHISR